MSEEIIQMLQREYEAKYKMVTAMYGGEHAKPEDYTTNISGGECLRMADQEVLAEIIEGGLGMVDKSISSFVSKRITKIKANRVSENGTRGEQIVKMVAAPSELDAGRKRGLGSRLFGKS
jgi:hypothetical protein